MGLYSPQAIAALIADKTGEWFNANKVAVYSYTGTFVVGFVLGCIAAW